MLGKVFSKVILSEDTPAEKMNHFERYATLIAPFLFPEIRLEVDLYDMDTVGIFTEKFGSSIKDFKIDTLHAPFTLDCFNLTPTLKSFVFVGSYL